MIFLSTAADFSPALGILNVILAHIGIPGARRMLQRRQVRRRLEHLVERDRERWHLS